MVCRARAMVRSARYLMAKDSTNTIRRRATFIRANCSIVNTFLLIFIASCTVSSSLAPLGVRLLRQEEYRLPPMRKFLPLPPINQQPPPSEPEDDVEEITCATFRVLQFNMLADGLSGLRDDLGAFSRTKAEDMLWGKRGKLLLHEILQYDPDIITLQECDHYYDCFLPELNARGYDGCFAPKPASACLEVSDRSDGCAIFVRRSKMYISSVETITYALRRRDARVDGMDADNTEGDIKYDTRKEEKKNSEEETQSSSPSSSLLDDEVAAKKKKKEEEDAQIRAQNQVALIAVCEVKPTNGILPPPLVIATTHLKASKNEQGEMLRLLEVNQLLDSVAKVNDAFNAAGRPPAIVITGDMNASPNSKSTGYSSKAYKAVKDHRLGIRSLLNDDLPLVAQASSSRDMLTPSPPPAPVTISNSGSCGSGTIPAAAAAAVVEVYEFTQDPPDINVWTTWKSRIKRGVEKVSRHCIDYIFYVPPSQKLSSSPDDGVVRASAGVRASAVLDLLSEEEVGPDFLPSCSYPSDHIAVVGELEMVLRQPKKK